MFVRISARCQCKTRTRTMPIHPICSLERHICTPTNISLALHSPLRLRSPGTRWSPMHDGFTRFLVPYYFFAGRITKPAPGDLAMDCIGWGFGSWRQLRAARSLTSTAGANRPLLIPREKLEDLIFMDQAPVFEQHAMIWDVAATRPAWRRVDLFVLCSLTVGVNKSDVGNTIVLYFCGA